MLHPQAMNQYELDEVGAVSLYLFEHKTNNMVNDHAIRLIDYICLSQREILFGDRTVFENNVARYSALKVEFERGPILNNQPFRRSFAYFYGMRYVSTAAKNAFFQKMDELRNNRANLSARQITENLSRAMGRNEFSFVTKMLNMLDDETYPIYDSQVGVVFQKPFLPDETRLDHQASVYGDIVDTYQALRQHEIIDAFRETYHCPSIGSFKVLDAIFWRLGKILDQDGLELTPEEYLAQFTR